MLTSGSAKVEHHIDSSPQWKCGRVCVSGPEVTGDMSCKDVRTARNSDEDPLLSMHAVLRTSRTPGGSRAAFLAGTRDPVQHLSWMWALRQQKDLDFMKTPIVLDERLQKTEGPELHKDTIPPGLETADNRET
ncbi:hypothetical protein MHYP_G00351240 [Metynnis hypsauchen]